MNRKQRRQHGITEKPAVYMYTQEQVDRIQMIAMRNAFKLLLSIPVVVLHDHFGFGQIRLDRFMNYALHWVESVQSGETKITDLMKLAEEESGVRVQDY